MPLSASDRGELEQAIDSAIFQMGKFVRGMRSLRQELSLRDVAEYSYGFAQGCTLGVFVASHGTLSKEEWGEAAGVIAKRGAEFREAMFKVG